jgi:NDP-sugar pyrophosphorylase family protein
MGMEKVDAIILAGGLGRRLRQVVSDRPKVLAEVNGRPFMDIILASLARSGVVTRVIIASGHMAKKVRDTYSNDKRFGFPIHFSEEDEPLGTGGAVRKALDLSHTRNVIAMNGDSFAELDYADCLSMHLSKQADLTIALKEVQDVGRYGSVIIGDNMQIYGFTEKIAGCECGFINAGIYIFKKELFLGVEPGRKLSMEKDLFPDFIAKKSVFGFICKGKFIDIGLPDTYFKAQKYLKNMMK